MAILGYVYITVADGHHAQILLADLLTGSGELGNGAHRSGFGALAAGVGVYLGVQYQDVHVFTAGQDVVQTAVTNVVGGTVTAEDPLAAGSDEVLEFYEFLAGVAAAFFGQRDNLVCNLAGGGGILRGFQPLGGEGLDFIAAARALERLLHGSGDGCTDAVAAELHAQAELAEVLEQ